MPDSDGKLTDADVAMVREYLRGKAVKDPYPCPYCGKAAWIMGGHVVLDTLPSGGPATLAIGTVTIVPYVPFFCTNCGFTMRFNAVLMGLYRAPSTYSFLYGNPTTTATSTTITEFRHAP